MNCTCEKCDCKREVDTALYISAFLVGQFLLKHGHHPKILCVKCKSGQHYNSEEPESQN